MILRELIDLLRLDVGEFSSVFSGYVTIVHPDEDTVWEIQDIKEQKPSGILSAKLETASGSSPLKSSESTIVEDWEVEEDSENYQSILKQYFQNFGEQL